MISQLFQYHLLPGSSHFRLILALLFTRQVRMKREHWIFKCTFGNTNKQKLFCFRRDLMEQSASQKSQRGVPPRLCFIGWCLEKLLLRRNWEDLLPRGKSISRTQGSLKAWTEETDSCGNPLGLDTISKICFGPTSTSPNPEAASNCWWLCVGKSKGGESLILKCLLCATHALNLVRNIQDFYKDVGHCIE